MNPEFVRNAWLELTPMRRWALPLVFTLVVFLFHVTGQTRTHEAYWSAFQVLGLVMFLLFSLWGGGRTSASVSSEVLGGTWDQQRLAPHRPWDLLLGKLFGSTVFTWQGAALGLLLYGIAGLALGRADSVGWSLLAWILIALWLQSAGLLASTATARHLRATRRPGQGALGAGPGVAMLVLLAIFLSPVAARLHETSRATLATSIDWWWTMPLRVFIPLSLAMFLAWTLVGAQRQLRAELQEPVEPGPWLAVLVFLTAYLFPLWQTSIDHPLVALAAVSATVWGVCLYPLLLAERKDIVRLRSLAAAWRRGDAREVWIQVPLWVVTGVGFAASLAVLLAGGLATGSATALTWFGVAATMGMLFLRDVAWISMVFVAERPHRQPAMVVLFFLALLYVLVPLVLGALGDWASPAIFLLLPLMPVAASADEGRVALSSLWWGLPGLGLAWAVALPRLRRALAFER